jgi:ribosomal protein S18 acetylase RimI-like enzyme
MPRPFMRPRARGVYNVEHPETAMSVHTQLRRLTAADAEAYRELRLEALQRDPEAFGSTFEFESSQPLAWFADRITNSEVFGAFRGAELAGVAGLRIPPNPTEAHKALLWGMYVKPDARNTGLGRQLIETISAAARPRAELIQLTVVSGNEPARRLYARLGFLEYGIEKHSIKKDGRYYDEVLMARDLLPEPGA